MQNKRKMKIGATLLGTACLAGAGFIGGVNYQALETKNVSAVVEEQAREIETLKKSLRDYYVWAPSGEFQSLPSGKFVKLENWGNREVSQEAYLKAKKEYDEARDETK